MSKKRFLAHRSPMQREDEHSCSILAPWPPPHTLSTPPEPPRRQRQAVPADGSVLAGGIHRPPNGAAVALRHTLGKLRNSKRIPRRAKAPQHVAMLVARLGRGECWEGKPCAGLGIRVTPTEYEAALNYETSNWPHQWGSTSSPSHPSGQDRALAIKPDLVRGSVNTQLARRGVT